MSDPSGVSGPEPAERGHTRYGRELTRKICERLANGELWHRMAGEPGMPAYATFYDWKRRHPEFAEAVAAAQEAAADYCADRALEVARNATKESVVRDRLEIDTLMQRAKLSKARGEKREPAERVEIVFYARRFEKVIGPDGRAFVREVKPDEEA